MAVDRRQADAAFSQAVRDLQGGQPEAAAAQFRQILAQLPNHGPSAAMLATVMAGSGQTTEAKELLERTIQSGPPDDAAHVKLSELLAGSGDFQAADATLVAALARGSRDANTYFALGQIRRAANNLPGAVDALRRAEEIMPKAPIVSYLLGLTLHDIGLWNEAMQALERAIALKPRFLEALALLGRIYRAVGSVDSAAVCYERALRIDPKLADLWVNLGNARVAQEDLERANECYRTALSLGRDDGLEIRRALTLPSIQESGDAIRTAREQLQQSVNDLMQRPLRVTDPVNEVGMANFLLAYHGDNDRPLMEAIAKLHLHSCPDLAWTAPHCRDWQPPTNRRIRILIVSRYFNRHTISQLFKGFVAQMDRDQFEVLVAQIGRKDDRSQQIAAVADQAIHLSGSLHQMRETIADLRPDILWYPEIGMEPNAYFLGFARLAPIQCVSWGHPDTTGIPNIDYFLSMAAAETEESDDYYSEQLVRLPVMGAYFKAPRVVEDKRGRRQWKFADDWNLYVCPQSLFKLHPDFDPVLAEILGRDPNGRLVLLEGTNTYHQAKIKARFSRQGADFADRVVYLPYQDREGFFNLLRSADCVLDPAYFCGGRTTYETIATGVPVVHRRGRFLRDRLTEAIYRQIGFAETIVDTDAQYVDMALRLAHDRDWRTTLGQTLREQGTVLYEDHQAIRQLEVLFRDMIAKEPAGRPD